MNPELLLASMSAPLFNNSLTIFRFPFQDALNELSKLSPKIKGVDPFFFFFPIKADLASNSFTTSIFSLQHAMKKRIQIHEVSTF